MATNNPVLRYLASWKNLAGCTGGLIGLLLHFAGFAGSYWLLVVLGLYGVGALAAPPERIVLVTAPEEEAGLLRTELDALVLRVRGLNVPTEVPPKLAEIAEVLRGMLDRPRELRADPDALHAVTRLVGTAKARELLFTAARLDARECERLGIANRVVPDAALEAESLALARQIAAGPPIAHRYMKQNLNLALVAPLETCLDEEAERMVAGAFTEDYVEAVKAFTEKRAPRFKGR